MNQDASQNWVVVAAAGMGTRFGAGKPKQFISLAGVPLLHRTLRALQRCPNLHGMVVVVPPSWEKDVQVLPQELRDQKQIVVAIGGERRMDSVRSGFRHLPAACKLVMIHDGARPQISTALWQRVQEGATTIGACVPVRPIQETIKRVAHDGLVLDTVDRERLFLVQTPQGFLRQVLEKAYQWLDTSCTHQIFSDEASLVEASGQKVGTVAGETGNIKVTSPEDLPHLQAMAPRVGFGYDLHRLAKDRSLVLGGVKIPHSSGLLGHSDADAPLHALADALLGAAALGDIGQHFPNTDPRYRGADSATLLAQVVSMVRTAGFAPSSADITILAERPKLSEYLPAMARRISQVLDIAPEAVGVKATTGEGIGFVGREEGIAAYAVAVLLPSLAGNRGGVEP